MIRRVYKYRIYPSKEQENLLNEILFNACVLYNHALAHRRKMWNEYRRSLSYYDQTILLKDWRNEAPQDNPLRLMPATAARSVLQRLDFAYKEFMKGKRGRPRFKSYKRFDSISYAINGGATIRENRLRLFSVGFVKVRWHRMLPAGKIKQVIILRKPSGWYACFLVELPEHTIEKSINPPIGVDIGIAHALALSDGSVFDSPKYLNQSLVKLRVLQRSVARKKRGSRNRKKAVRKLARQYEKVANQRRDWWHKVTRQLVDSYGVIVLEDLSLKFMLQNGHLSRTTHDVGLGLFRELLNYKAMDAGVEIATVNPKNTSQICSGCGRIVQKSLGIRVHSCPDCGLTIDRDVNAALNVLQLGRSCWDVTWPIAASVSQEALSEPSRGAGMCHG